MRVKQILFLRKISNIVSRLTHSSIPNRIIRNLAKKVSGNVRINDFDGDLYLDLEISEHMQSRIFWLGYYNKDIISFIDDFIKPGMTAIDIGANIGEISLILAKRVTPTGLVISFEPVDTIYALLLKNLRNNNITWVKAEKYGLFDKSCDANIYTAGNSNPDDNIGLGSLYPTKDINQLIQQVSLITLDSYIEKENIQHVDLIKIDIEGAELQCLKGAYHTIKKHRPHIVIEVQKVTSNAAGYSPEDIIHFLRSMGYTLSKIGKDGTLSPLSCNTLSDYQNILAHVAQPLSNITVRGY